MAAVKYNDITGFSRGVLEDFALYGMFFPKRRYKTTSQRRATSKKREVVSGKHALVGTAGSSFAKTILQLAVLLIVY